MADRNYTIVFQTDTSGALAGIGAMEKAVVGLDGAVHGFGRSMATVGASVTNAVANLDDATSAFHNAAAAGKATGDSILGINSALVASVAGFAALQIGTAALGKLGEMANEARDRIKEIAIETMNLRDKMRELANLQGKPGPDNEVTGEAIKLGMQAGMTPDEAVKYLEQFEGSSPAGEQKGNIDPKTKAQLMVEGAKFGTRVKLSPSTAGDLAGVMSQYGKIPNVEQGMATMGRVAMGLNEGRGNLEPLVRSLINTAGAVVGMGGPVEDLGELAAIQGVASTHANPRESGTRVRQAVRSLRDLQGPAAMYLESVGIKDGMSHMQRLERLRDDVRKADASGQGADSFLLSQGFTDQDEVRAVVEQVRDYDVIQGRIAKGRGITGRSVMAADDNFLEKERAGIRRKQVAKQKGQEFLIGEENERMQMAMENAEQKLRAEGKIGGTVNARWEVAEDLFGFTSFIGLQSSRENKKYLRAEQDLIADAEKRGIGRDQAMGMLGYERKKNSQGEWWEDNRTEAQRTRGFNLLATEDERRGGNAIGAGPDLTPKFDQLITEQRETNRILKQRKDNAMPNGPGAFLPAPGRPGGNGAPQKGAAQPKRP